MMGVEVKLTKRPTFLSLPFPPLRRHPSSVPPFLRAVIIPPFTMDRKRPFDATLAPNDSPISSRGEGDRKRRISENPAALSASSSSSAVAGSSSGSSSRHTGGNGKGFANGHASMPGEEEEGELDSLSATVEVRSIPLVSYMLVIARMRVKRPPIASSHGGSARCLSLRSESRLDPSPCLLFLDLLPKPNPHQT